MYGEVRLGLGWFMREDASGALQNLPILGNLMIQHTFTGGERTVSSIASSKRIFVVSALVLAVLALPGNAPADTFWLGTLSNDWSTAGNWSNGVPASGAGNGFALVLPGANGDPVVSTAGNTTDGEVLISSGAGMSVVAGGQLDVAANFVTGALPGCLPVTIAGGHLNIAAGLAMGHGDGMIAAEGDVIISDGTLSAAGLTINPDAGASIDMTGGELILPIGTKVGNVISWINSGAITAFGGTGTINVDETTSPGYMILTPVQGGVVTEESFTAVLGGSICFTVQNPGTAGDGDFTWTFTPQGGGSSTVLPAEDTETVCLVSVGYADAGTYVASFDDGSKAPATFTVTLSIEQPSPAAGFIGLGIVSGVLAMSGVLGLRRRKR